MTMIIVAPVSTHKNLKMIPNAGCHPSEGCKDRTMRIAKTKLMMKRMRTPAATNIEAAMASLIFRECTVDAIRSIDVRTRDTQKTVAVVSTLWLSRTTEYNTEDEEIEQKLVTSCSVLLEDLHMDCCADHEKNHEHSLRRYVDFLHRSTTQCPCCWRIW
jgi:hypothetical protein